MRHVQRAEAALSGFPTGPERPNSLSKFVLATTARCQRELLLVATKGFPRPTRSKRFVARLRAIVRALLVSNQRELARRTA